MISDSFTLSALEWTSFLEKASLEAASEPARERILGLKQPEKWAESLSAAQNRQVETQEMTTLLDRDALWGPLRDLKDPHLILESLFRKGVLELRDLVLLRAWCLALDSWVQIPRELIKGESFKKSLTQLSDPDPAIRILDRVLTPEGELSEKASPKLAGLFSEIRSLKKEIAVRLDQIVKSYDQKGVLQESFSDLRDGHYVIPVRTGSQSEVEGTFFEASASRQTVFIEPKEITPLNNKLRSKQNELAQEVDLILRETSEKLAEFSPDFASSFSILIYWDAVQTRARLARKYGGRMLKVTEDRVFALNQAAHPLLVWTLDADQIIRNEFLLGPPSQTLLLTGPNAGGKSVFMKMLGIAGIFARTGFFLTGSEGLRVPFFDSILADFGDPQSLDQNLSSFSGHITRLNRILENATAKSLILIDELNSATDPQEGAALARAILETLMNRGSIIVATTHDPILKGLSVSEPRVVCGGMLFDEAVRIPTYKLMLGTPARSRALETAERFGLDPEVIKLAQTHLEKDHVRFEQILSDLEREKSKIESERREATRFREEAEKLEKEWTEKTRIEVTTTLEKTKQKLKRIIEQAQDEARSQLKNLDEIRIRRTLEDAFKTSSQKIESTLKEEAPELAALIDQPVKIAPETKTPQIGMRVRVPKWKSVGTILEVQKDKIKVSLGKLQVLLQNDEYELIENESAPAEQKSFQKTKTKSHLLERPYAPDSQIDLRGKRFDDAMSELEAYLDLAFRSGGLVEVTIVHGLGTGAIREGTRKLLKKLPYVKDVRDGGVGAGGSGATIVTFDLE